MRKVFFILSIVALTFCTNACKSKENIDSSIQDSSKKVLDWKGVYTGIIPCADCPGISTQISLSADSTYRINWQYMDKDDQVYTDAGSFQWDETKGAITLNDQNKESPSLYKLGENSLTQLDMDGNIVEGELAKNYVLVKVDENLMDKQWHLKELFNSPVTEKVTKDAHIVFKMEGNRVFGSSSCNNFSGYYRLEPGNRISFSSLIATQKLCINMEIETDMNKALNMTDSYSVKEDTLILNRARMAPLARFEAVK